MTEQLPSRPQAPAARARLWRLRDRELDLSARPLLMGIVNVTPDSFSDGGQFDSTSLAVDHALRLVEEGADLIDVGGESTRPYSDPVDLDEELRRVIPVVESLARETKVPISIDTSKSAVAEAAIAAGATIINDVTALAGDSRMVEVALSTGAGVCAMHMQGTPPTMQDAPSYVDVVAEVMAFLANRLHQLVEAGIHGEKICLDPGLGFGKTTEHNLLLISNCWQLHRLGCPVLVGHSRKGFLGKVLGNTEADRTIATVAASLSLAQQGVQILRVHDIKQVREGLEVFFATGGNVCYREGQ